MSDKSSERGYGSQLRRLKSKERNPELVFPRNQFTYEEMVRTSAKVAQITAAVTQLILRATWRVSPNGATDEIVQHVADDLRLPVHGKDDGVSQRRTAGRVSWQEHLQKAVMAPFYGCAYFEQVYKVGDDGREHLWKLAHRHNTTIQKVAVAKDGGLEGIRQHPINGHEVFIPTEHLVAYVYNPRDTAWTGESLLRPAHKHWLAIADLEELEFQILHRNGMGFPAHEQSESTPDEERKQAADDGLEIAQGVYAGDIAGATLRPGEKLSLIGVTGQTPSPRDAIDYHNDKIAESVLANTLNLNEGGSYAMAGTLADFFFNLVQSIAEWIASTANQHIIQDLVSVAFPDYDGPAPLLTFTPIAAKKQLPGGELAQLVAQGALLREPNLEQWIRQNYDIPAPRSLYEAIEDKKKRVEAEQAAGVTLSDEPIEDTAIDDVERTVETNARYRAVMMNQEEISRMVDAKLEHLRGKS